MLVVVVMVAADPKASLLLLRVNERWDERAYLVVVVVESVQMVEKIDVGTELSKIL